MYPFVCLSVHSSLGRSQWMVKSRVISELQEACWDMVSAMAGDIILLLDSDNDGVRTHAIKFVEGLIVTLSPRVADSEVPRRQEHDISLDRIPRDHPYIQYSEWPSSAGALCHSTGPLPLPPPPLFHYWCVISGDSIVQWLRALTPGSSPSFTTYSSCDLGQVTSLGTPFSFCKMEAIVVPLSRICSEVL